MHFEFNQPGELLTPTINDGCVNRKNPLSSPCDFLSHDDDFLMKDNSNDNSERDREFDLLSTFELPVLSDLENTGLELNDLQLEKYISQSSFTSFNTDANNDIIPDESTFPWIGEECTVASENVDDMFVPSPSPSASSESTLSSTLRQSTKKAYLTPTERKLRKKDQNKTAAEKYRLKKKAERNELLTRYTDLKTQNHELKFEVQSLANRLEQFKQLFVDVLQIPISSNKSN